MMLLHLLPAYRQPRWPYANAPACMRVRTVVEGRGNVTSGGSWRARGALRPLSALRWASSLGAVRMRSVRATDRAHPQRGGRGAGADTFC